MVDSTSVAQTMKKPSRVLRPPPKGFRSNVNVVRAVPLRAPPSPPPPPPHGPATLIKSTPPPPPPPRVDPTLMKSTPPPPAPLPPPLEVLARRGRTSDKVNRVPEVFELYQRLSKRKAEKVSPEMSNSIEELKKISPFFLTVQDDVDTKGEFVMSLAATVRSASFSDIEDVIPFINWLDAELSFLVDEGAVLKHFDWPTMKEDKLRDAAFEYKNLAMLEKQVSSYQNDLTIPFEEAISKMNSMLQKVQQREYILLKKIDRVKISYNEYGIPINWLMDTGLYGKIKLSLIQLATRCMERIVIEIDSKNRPGNEEYIEFLVLQGIRFAFRVHQFAGGIDAECNNAFEELRKRAYT